MPEVATSPGARSSPRKPRVVAFVPARGGSVSIPKKNIKPLLGRPLLDWVVQPAIDSGVFDEVWVSTDCDLIAAAAHKSGALVHRRAAETATATASTESAMKDFVDSHPDYDVLCLIQATSPLLTPADFVDGWKLMRAQQADSLVTAVRAHRFLWTVDAKTGEAKAQNYDPVKRPRRQDWNGELVENGAFYMTTRKTWETYGCRLGGKIALHEMDEHTFVELDSPTDWLIVSHIAATHGYFPKGVARPAVDGDDAGAGTPYLALALGAAAAALAVAASRLVARK